MPPKIECDIVIGPGVKMNNLKMVQGDDAMIERLSKLEGKEVYIKGDPSEPGMVMCTEDSTYEITTLETTNSCMLCKRQDGEDKIILGMADHTAVVKRIPGCIASDLKKLLEKGRYNTQQIVSRLKASEAEIKSALHNSPAVFHEDAWVLCDKSDTEHALETLLRIGDAVMDLDRFTQEESIEKLKEYHEEIVLLSVVKSFCTEADDKPFFKVSAEKVARCYAGHLFAATPTWPLETFMSEWVSCCPAFVVPTETMLKGFALIKPAKPERTITYFPSVDLPGTPEERFAKLFDAMPQWEPELLKYYIQPLVGPGTAEAQLISRYTREFTIGGKQMYVPF
eukprot:TRINITY_DN6443_c0_g1_i1.p1 TRINITY_DN6443_c0_g1~~TRINITY_DN6443_c0_g1_i1.p1  ORF type:complete len:356 (+),score=65.59 TRINITY_DN6443_c0_g1_i1:54-1070(+)